MHREVIMSCTTVIKTVFLSGLFIGSSFASAPAPSPYAKPFDSTSLHSQPSPLAMAGTAGINALGICSGACPERSEGADVASSTVPFERTAHGLVFSCPKISADQPTMGKMQEILAKVKNDTLTQDDAILKSLTSSAFSGLGECRCEDYERSKGDRAKFENILVQTCAKNLDKPFTYINYGSGLLFQDLVVATKLIQAGCANITLICIDPAYTEFRETFNNVQPLQQHQGEQGAVQINNALYVCATYFSLLKNIYSDLSVTLKLYENAAQAMQDNKPKSVQLIFVADFGGKVDAKITDALRSSIKARVPSQHPQVNKPYYHDAQTGKDTLVDFFVMADLLLVQNGIKMVLSMIGSERDGFLPTTDICHHHAFGNITVSLNKRIKNSKEALSLVINNRYRLSIDGGDDDDDVDDVVEDLIDMAKYQLNKQECPFVDDLLGGKVAIDESHALVLAKLVTDAEAASKE